MSATNQRSASGCLSWVAIGRETSRPSLRREPIKELRDDLKQVIEENK